MATTAKDKKAIVQRFFEDVWHDGDIEAADDVLTTDHVTVGVPSAQETVDREEHKEFIAMVRGAYPDIRYEYDADEMVVDGDADAVATSWTATGTHEGELLGLEPTGNEVSVRGVFIARFEDGQIARMEGVWDELGMLQQLGAVPEQQAQ